MTFWDDEKSLQGSTPIELHEFSDGTDNWRYVDGPANESYGGNTYTVATIRGDKVESTGNALRNMTRVTCDWTLPFAWQFTTSPPDAVITYTRTRLQGSNGIVIFKGTVNSVSFKQRSRTGKRYASIELEPFTSSARARNSVLRYDRKCVVPLYSTLCGVTKASYKVTGSLTSVATTIFQATEFGTFSNGYFDGGELIVRNRKRKILNHTGTALIVVRGIYGAAVGDAFEAYPGCNRTTDCVSRFNNLNNQRACPNIPEEEDNPLGYNGAI